MMKKAQIYIGTSGWHYKHWKGNFYPEAIKNNQQFSYYTSLFESVEINNSFYRLPEASTFTSWREAAPKGFIFSVKASRYLTHMVKLKAGRGGMQKLFSHISRLEEKLGPILFQLPPRWNLNINRLGDFLAALPPEHRYTFEFRNTSWYTEEVYALLKKWNCAFCIYHLENHLSPLMVTANFVYIRLHGPGNKYQGSYTTRTLNTWASRCKEWIADKKDVYIYFDNDQEGFAAKNALKLKSLLTK